MSKKKNAIIWLMVSFLFCFLCIGYAVVQDELNVFGSLSLDVADVTVLQSGSNLNSLINEIAETNTVTRIVFDKQDNQQTVLDNAGIDFDTEGTEVQIAGSKEIKAFLVDETIYILSRGSLTIEAGVDCSGMFSPAADTVSTIEEIVFYNFQTSNTTNMSEMFRGCGVLTTIYANESFYTDDISSSTDMFAECYLLCGGLGTYAYPDYPTDQISNNGLDHNRARIDGEGGLPGYFTDTFTHFPVYFASNLLKPEAEAATYNVHGSEALLSLANALDSYTYSQMELNCQTIIYYWKDGGWQEFAKQWNTLTANRMVVEEILLTPVEVEGVIYDRIFVKSTCANGMLETLCAEFVFQYGVYTTEYSYDAGVIRLVLFTNDEGGNFRFAWIWDHERSVGIAPDNSDPNLIFTHALASDLQVTTAIGNYTGYEFCFFVTSAEMRAALESATGDALQELMKSYVSVSRVSP